MFSHIELNVSDLPKSLHFYQTTLHPLGFCEADSGEDYVRLTNGRNAVIVLCPASAAHASRGYHRHAIGLSHFAIAVQTRSQVDDMATHLDRLGITLLGDGVVELDYRRGYYTLAFEDPDRMMIEIVWSDPHYFAVPL